MSPFNKLGLRVAGAGAAATALTLAAAAPAFAQDPADLESFEPVMIINDERFDSSSFTVHSILTENPHPGQMELGFTPEQAAQISKVLAVFEVGSGAAEHVELFTDDEDCRVDGVDVICEVDNSSGDALASGLLTFDFAIGPDVETMVGGQYAYSYLTTLTTTSGEAVYGGFSGGFEYAESALEPGDGGSDPIDEEEDYYEFAFLDNWITDVNVGETVTAAPQIQVSGAPAADRAGTLVWFTDTVDMDAWYEEDWFDFSEVATGHATVVDGYDNCSRVVVGHLACILADWNPDEGETYAPSAGSPVQFLVEGQVDEQDISVYSAFDLTEEDLEFYTDWLEVDLDGAEQFSLSKVADAEVGDPDYFYSGEAWILFEAGLDDLPHPNLPGGEDPSLPSTGNSSIILISSAAAALLAGAVVFFMLRRRKAATNWE